MLLFLRFYAIFVVLKYITKDVFLLQKKNQKQLELNRLYRLLEQINERTLAADYELRWQLKQAKEQVIDKIKAIESKSIIKKSPVVEYTNG